MEERQVTIDGERYPLSPLFMCSQPKIRSVRGHLFLCPRRSSIVFCSRFYFPIRRLKMNCKSWPLGCRLQCSAASIKLTSKPLREVDAIPRCPRGNTKYACRGWSAALYCGHRPPDSRSCRSTLWRQPAAAVALLLCSKALSAIRGLRLLHARRRARYCQTRAAPSTNAARRSRTRPVPCGSVITDILQSAEVPR